MSLLTKEKLKVSKRNHAKIHHDQGLNLNCLKYVPDSHRTRRREEIQRLTLDKDIYLDYDNAISIANIKYVPDVTQTNAKMAEKSADEPLSQGTALDNIMVRY